MTTRSMTARKQPRQWQVRDQAEQSVALAAVSRVRAIGTLAAALAVVVIWPQATGSGRDTSASTAPPGRIGDHAGHLVIEPRHHRAACVRCGRPVAVTEAPSPPVVTASPADYAGTRNRCSQISPGLVLPAGGLVGEHQHHQLPPST